MKLTDIAIIIDKIPLKEDRVIIKALTKNHGIYSGVAKSTHKKQTYLPQKSDFVDFIWQARLTEHIGYCNVGLINSNFSFLMHDKKKLYSINSILDLINISFKERDTHTDLFNNLESFLKKLCESSFSFFDYILMEMKILKECGYWLDLSKCASTGQSNNLIYVSSRSGKAVSREAGEQYKNILLKLPQFILETQEPHSLNEITQAKELTEYFFKRYIFSEKQEIQSRERFFHLIKTSTCFKSG